MKWEPEFDAAVRDLWAYPARGSSPLEANIAKDFKEKQDWIEAEVFNKFSLNPRKMILVTKIIFFQANNYKN